jgi:hypothetical protein
VAAGGGWEGGVCRWQCGASNRAGSKKGQVVPGGVALQSWPVKCCSPATGAQHDPCSSRGWVPVIGGVQGAACDRARGAAGKGPGPAQQSAGCSALPVVALRVEEGEFCGVSNSSSTITLIAEAGCRKDCGCACTVQLLVV